MAKKINRCDNELMRCSQPLAQTTDALSRNKLQPGPYPPRPNRPANNLQTRPQKTTAGTLTSAHTQLSSTTLKASNHLPIQNQVPHYTIPVYYRHAKANICTKKLCPPEAALTKPQNQIPTKKTGLQRGTPRAGEHHDTTTYRTHNLVKTHLRDISLSSPVDLFRRIPPAGKKIPADLYHSLITLLQFSFLVAHNGFSFDFPMLLASLQVSSITGE